MLTNRAAAGEETPMLLDRDSEDPYCDQGSEICVCGYITRARLVLAALALLRVQRT